MNEQSKFRQETIADFASAWSLRRGIESTDRNAIVTFVWATLDQLSDVLAEKAITTKRDVVGSEIELSKNFAFAFQIPGHNWSIVLKHGASSLMPTTEKLSAQFRQSIVLIMSDTCGSIYYDLCEDGEVIESFDGEEVELEDGSGDLSEQAGYQGYVLTPDPDYPESKQVAYFKSRSRKVTAEEIGDIWGFTDRFMREASVYDPAIDLDYLLGEDCFEPGNSYQVQDPGFVVQWNRPIDLDYLLGEDFFKTGNIYQVQDPEFAIPWNRPSEEEVKLVPDLVRVDYFDFGT
jgi:hypothetical protein